MINAMVGLVQGPVHASRGALNIGDQDKFAGHGVCPEAQGVIHPERGKDSRAEGNT